MASGLAALLDDVAAIARLAAASLDDVSAAAGKTSMKAAGVVVDDAAVTPTYVTGFSPERELPMIWRIALGSLRNKLLLLLPAALLLSAFLPAAITPLLMLGGAFLCFEGAEKVVELLGGHHGTEEAPETGDPAHLEQAKVSGAIRTDLILSGEIMAISLAEVAGEPLAMQALVLAAVGLVVTVGVYGVVALIVKLDDIGLHLARRQPAAVRRFGRGLVKLMPTILGTLETVGMAAMLWVGGGIILHGLEGTPLAALPHAVHDMAAAVSHASVVLWTINALLSAVFGFLAGLVIVGIVHVIGMMRGRH
ncbi:conserved hypothetical membrane protein [Sphingobium sp. SYK-6]|uniref:DUF808 domain-containing protein n=1 Tax=Sphingobium sp. (strain NBRC 103272 / SYK-6) TaxID=627192 RepID=UPI0002276CDE|nr:DUF808 domain-containing protein [Sphingobium sp. SYK-6]BAK64950.1 conserved hypothetical membrane protein [Sphingobium sp. SYK-6]